MGQKVNPHGLRVGVIKDWDSRWFARDNAFGDILVEDYNLRKFLKKKLYDAGVPKIEIERTADKVRINIHCARPGIVIGKGGAEIESGLCLVGAHKDDLLITINGADARSYASQGQTRTAALSLKLAEREIFLAETGETPVLLLDDVLSELDSARQEFVLNRIGGGQTLVSCCEAASVERMTGGRVLYMDKGRVNEVCTSI